ncbi:TolC family protein, partial [Klebsiella pneumoniae]|nr:TolC family protein [Klebsiella pneumoniae]
MKALESALEAANADIGIASAQRYPAVSVVGAVGRQWIESGGSTIDFNTWSFGPQLTLPIFAGGALAAQVDAREAAYAEALGALR